MNLTTTNGVVFQVSDCDVNKVSMFNWHFDKSNGYVMRNQNKRKIYLHRFILGGNIIDHKDMDKLNNTRENLRSVSKSLNNINRKSLGIYYDSYGNRWRACISHNNKTLKLGSFKSAKEALATRINKLHELHPEMKP